MARKQAESIRFEKAGSQFLGLSSGLPTTRDLTPLALALPVIACRHLPKSQDLIVFDPNNPFTRPSQAQVM